jgi:hypothetical protein
MSDEASKHRALARMAEVAEDQRTSALRLRDYIALGLKYGATWRELGEALHVEHTGLYRQYAIGRPIVVVRCKIRN